MCVQLLARYLYWPRYLLLGATSSLGLLISFFWQPTTLAQVKIHQATVAEILQSNQVYIQNRQARINDKAQSGERISTRQARAVLQFNNGAVGRLGNHASLTVGRQCFQLQRGQILINGSANGCTGTVVTGVRGTTYVLQVDESGREQVRVLEGEVTVGKATDRRFAPITIPQGNQLEITQGKFGKITQLSQQEYDETLKSNLFDGYSNPMPGLLKLKRAYETLYPGTAFPLTVPNSGRQTQQGWDTHLKVVRLTTAQSNSPVLALQLTIFDKPATTYANAVYQLYALKNNQWVRIYSNVGARLIPNASRPLAMSPELIPLTQLDQTRLGNAVNWSDLTLKGVVQIRYDLPNGPRDARLELNQSGTYQQLPTPIEGVTAAVN